MNMSEAADRAGSFVPHRFTERPDEAAPPSSTLETPPPSPSTRCCAPSSTAIPCTT